MYSYGEICEEEIKRSLEKLNNFSEVEGFYLIYDALLNLHDNQQFIMMGKTPKDGLIRKAANGSLRKIRFLLLKQQKRECQIFHYCIFLH